VPRVVHVIARMNVGGPAQLLVQLLEGLPDQTLLTGDVEAGEADHLELRSCEAPSTRVPGLGRSARPGNDLRALGFLVRELRRLRPDVVHTHTAKAGTLGRIAAELARVPAVVHTFHGHLLHGYFSPRVTRAVAGTERLLARRTDRIVAVGEQVRDDLLAAGIGRPQQYTVIPPGVRAPTPGSRSDSRARLAIAPDDAVVAVVGRLTTVKRPDRMLEVARLLPDVTVLVAGEGPLLETTRRNAPPNVRFLGWRNDVDVIYAAADAMLLTSDNEGMPVALIEAAMCGIPAVSTDVGSAREVVTGEVVAPEPQALAVALRRVLAQDLRAQAKRTAMERFGVERMLRLHAELYASLAQRT
jgi:glycosyltransferase involved in cell wall biosynthesis